MLLSGPTLSFQIEVTLAVHLEKTEAEIELREEPHRNQSKVSTIIVGSQSYVIAQLSTIARYQAHIASQKLVTSLMEKHF